MAAKLPESLARTTIRAIVASIALLLAGAQLAHAGGPTTTPSVVPPTDFAAGAACAFPVRFENLQLKARDSVWPTKPDGSSRLLSRGSGDSVVTNLDTGKAIEFRGGFRIDLRFAGDGSIRADATGLDYILWYLPGDNSELGSGLFRLNGHATEWYDPSGQLIRATASGDATDLCAALAP